MDNSTFAQNTTLESNSISNIIDDIGRVTNLIVLVITVFILFSLIVYGTRRQRWRTPPGGSSLHSGIIFTCVVIATAMSLPRLVVNEIVHYMRVNNRTILDCEVASNISGAFYFITQCALYVFLCLLLYKIYVHPYVRDKVKKCWQRFIPVFSVVSVIVIIAAAILTVRSVPVTWHENRGCGYGNTASNNLAAALVSIGWVIIQAFMVSMYLNAAFHTHLVSRTTDSESGRGDCVTHCCERCRIMCPCGFKRSGFPSPVEMTVKRGVHCVLIIVVSDVIMTITTIYIFPRVGLHSFPSMLLDISVLVNVLCAISALGCASEALGWWFPKCPETSNRQKDSQITVERKRSAISEGQD